jgi:hypothetical protein
MDGWSSLRVEPGAGLPEEASRAMAPAGGFCDGEVAAMAGVTGISNTRCPVRLNTSENPL